MYIETEHTYDMWLTASNASGLGVLFGDNCPVRAANKQAVNPLIKRELPKGRRRDGAPQAGVANLGNDTSTPRWGI